MRIDARVTEGIPRAVCVAHRLGEGLGGLRIRTRDAGVY